MVIGIGGTTFNALVSDECGVCGSVGVGILSFSLYLEIAMFEPRSAYFSFFQNAHQSQMLAFVKGTIVIFYFFILYINYPNALFYCLIFSYFISVILQTYFEPVKFTSDEE